MERVARRQLAHNNNCKQDLTTKLNREPLLRRVQTNLTPLETSLGWSGCTFRNVDKRLRKDNPVAVAGLLIRLPALVFDLF